MAQQEDPDKQKLLDSAFYIPLMEGSDDEVFLGAIESAVPPLVEAFRPDVVTGHLKERCYEYARDMVDNIKKNA